MLDAIAGACRDAGWDVAPVRASVVGADSRPALWVQRGQIGLLAVDEGRFVRLCWLTQLNAEEIGQVCGLSVAARRRLKRSLERLCSEGRTTGSIFEETRDEEPVIVGVLLEQRLVASAGGNGVEQRAVDGFAEIAVIARRVAATLTNISEVVPDRPRRPGVAGTDPMVG